MSDHRDEPLDSFELELADTRPSMIWAPYVGGIPVDLAALLVFVFGQWTVSTGDWRVVVLAPGIWWIGSWLMESDLHALTLIQRYLATSAWSLDSKVQGGAGPTTMPLRTRRPRGM